MSRKIELLQEAVDLEWKKISNGDFFQTVLSKGMTIELYQEVMAQIYHYTKNNSKNQAAAAYSTDHEKVGLLKFMFKHALEELGHERMIISDLKSIGLNPDDVINQRPPLPATEALNQYLYSVAINKGGIARLGYSFWAEDSYEYIQDILDACRRDLLLVDKNMSFFVSHSHIDAKHAEEVNEIIEKWVQTEEEFNEVTQVARTTLFLTGELLNQAAHSVQQSIPKVA